VADLKLKVKKRKIFGRKVKRLRQEGILPANIYGKKIKSLAVELPEKEFLDVYQKAKETSIIDLTVEGEKEGRPVLVANLQTDPVTGQKLHVDFHQVALTEKTTATVPLVLVGQSPAVSQKIGILVQQINEVEVEALPADLPEKLLVDISGLTRPDEAVYVKDIKGVKGVEIKAEGNQIVAKIAPLAKEEVEEKPAEGQVEETKQEEKAEQKV